MRPVLVWVVLLTVQFMYLYRTTSFIPKVFFKTCSSWLQRFCKQIAAVLWILHSLKKLWKKLPVDNSFFDLLLKWSERFNLDVFIKFWIFILQFLFLFLQVDLLTRLSIIEQIISDMNMMFMFVFFTIIHWQSNMTLWWRSLVDYQKNFFNVDICLILSW